MSHTTPGNHLPPRPRPPFRFPVIYLRPVQSCRPVYHNQATLDALNAMLAGGCERLEALGGIKCSETLIRNLENELMRQMSIARYIGQNCAQPTIY